MKAQGATHDTPIGKLDPQDWMVAPETIAVMKALMADGHEARFVGGCVRDGILKRPVTDVDIATPETPERVMELMATAGIKAIPTGIDHGTITVVAGSRHYEVTTLRVDTESHGRHATVDFTEDWLIDAQRRDFTINTLSSNIDGDVFDLLGGMDDLGNRWVRFVGVARERVEEDILRLLRYFRFYATFGNPPPDKDALAACRLLAPRLKELSSERVRDELLRILDAPHPADTIVLMNGERVLEHCLPEAVDFGRLRMMSWMETTAIKVETVTPDTLRRLASLLEVDPDGHGELAQRLRLSNHQRERLNIMTRDDFSASPEASEKEIRAALQQTGAESVRDRALLAWAGEMAENPRHPSKRTDAWLGVIKIIDDWKPKTLPVKGSDALDLGLQPGERVGEVLKGVEDWWRDGDFQADRDACLEKLKNIINA
ncbi:MAG: CCA tRNA nucleotidyltransferase [Rhodospirillaceae bacterium]|jgi:poly(A) polymerase|nr:CCA tRNA nucleotidyltransferase [Alphaproteobacteria bacterium]MBT4218608.1 CCA tRNA nucleotidyltransferase [Rhodospirillaceae bacterium]MBT5013991.1 CCA tRNA nucleotidyltransferase [Rhodospirillaceae bacterium]MBT5309160.1 CCA tRNA nucleotidyltransferase [Rhodospirillaceae bacterium]MBT6406973.1 CCA tRNA nucleotidyltransferase [Rhodospirillaceae bacterium]